MVGITHAGLLTVHWSKKIMLLLLAAQRLIDATKKLLLLRWEVSNLGVLGINRNERRIAVGIQCKDPFERLLRRCCEAAIYM